MGAMWQQQKKITVAGTNTATFTLNFNTPLERLTIWVSSGDRSIVNLSFQNQINGVNLGAAVTVVGAKAAKVIFSSGGAAAEDNMIPWVDPTKTPDVFDRFVFSVLITNADAAPAVVTVLAVGIQHQGG